MESQKHDDAYNEYLDDPILLNFGENALCLENMEFLDPGIIDLDCDSDEDCKIVDEDTIDIKLSGEDTSPEPVISTNRVIVKPASIKLVDCYKFPWFFDKPTKDIIENKITEASSKGLRMKEDERFNETDDNNTNCSAGINNDSKQMIGINSNELINKSDKCVNKEIDSMYRMHKLFNAKVIDSSKLMAIKKKNDDTELLKAISQRNKTEVDFKKNKGLVGMKIERMPNKKQPIEIKKQLKKQANIQEEINKQLTLDKLYLHAVNEALNNMHTTITPVFDGKSGYIKENGPNKNISQDTKTDSSGRSFDSMCNLKLPENLKGENFEKDFKHTSVRKDINEEDNMLTEINNTKKIAEKIVRAVTPYRGGICQTEDIHKSHEVKRKQCKPMPLLLKIKNDQKEMHVEEKKATLKHQKSTEGFKMAKMITPIPLSSKKQTKATKVANSGEVKELKSPRLSSMPSNNTSDKNIIVVSESKEVKNNKQETGNIQTTKVFTTKPACPAHVSGPNKVYKSFKLPNKYTENILNKIQAKSRLQSNKVASKINKPDKLLTKPAKKALDYVVQGESTDECKTASSVSITTANATEENGNVMKDVRLHARSLDETKKAIINSISPETSHNLALQYFAMQYSNENSMNSPKPNESYLNKHLEFKNYIALKTSVITSVFNGNPLNTIIMKTAKTDDAKIDEANSEFIENTQSNGNKPVKHLITEQLASAYSTSTKRLRKQSLKKIPVEHRNIENYMKNKGNSKPMHVAKSPSVKKIALTAKDEHAIQTIITSHNELNVEKLDDQQRVNNITIVPKTQAAIIIKPTEIQKHQTPEKNKPLAVPNSMQSHILYKPQGETRSPQMNANNPEASRCKRQINQQPLDPILYPPLCTEPTASNTAINVRSPSEVSTLMSDRTMPLDVKGPILPQTEIIERLPGATGARLKILDANKPILPQMGMNVHPHLRNLNVPLSMNRGNSLHVGMNERSIPSGIMRPIPPQMGSNKRHAGISGSVQPHGTMNAKSMPVLVEEPISPQIGMNPRPREAYKSNSPHMTMNDRSPRDCHIQPGEVFWSYAFPPPKPQPPPPLPLFSHTTRFPFIEQEPDSSIIGRNKNGIIKKICLIANHNTLDTSTKEDIVKVVDMELDSTPIYDEVLESQSAKTKSEMLQVLDTSSMQLIESPIKHDTVSNSSNRSPAKNLKKVLPKAIDIRNENKYKSKHGLSHDVDIPMKVNYTRNYTEISTDRTPVTSNVMNFKVAPSHKSMIDETLAYKANQLPAANSNRCPNFPQLLDYNRRPSDNSNTNNESNLNNVTQSKPPQMQIEEFSASFNKIHFEDNERTAIRSKITGNASNLKNTTTSKANNSVKQQQQTVGYKPGPLSKKMKFNDSSVSPKHSKTNIQTLPSMRNSSPILPIAQKDLDIPVSMRTFDKINVKIKKKVGNVSPSKLSRKRRQFEQARNKVYGSKKISIDDYKKRSANKRRTDEEAVAFMYQKETFQKNTVDVPRRASHVDSDLGYDSDATVKL